MSSDFYRAFEEKHRGPRELIKGRLKVYLPFIKHLKDIYPDAPAVDLGCGRGEWLELLGENGFAAQGVDLDDGMLEACRELGLTVQTGEAIDFLKKLPDQSQVVISGFHIAEHIPFDDLQTLVEESLRVLRPAGVLILETPNPENIVVGTSSFYLDPTHIRPIPPQLLSFIPDYYGYKRVKVLRLQETVDIASNENLSLLNVLKDVSPDYAVVAQKSADDEVLALNSRAFESEYGVTLEQLADTYNQRAEARAQQLYEELNSVYASRSWRITWPLRKAQSLFTWLRGDRRMRIGIDYSPVAGERTGVGQYAYNLVHALARVDKKNSYLLYSIFYYIFNADFKKIDIPTADNFKIPSINNFFPVKFLRYLWSESRSLLVKEYLLGNVDVVHSTTFCAPRFRRKNKRLVVTIYDLTVITHPECHQEENIRHCSHGIKDAVKYADAIIAISEHTKADLMQYFNVPEDMITVTYLAADPMYKPVSEPAILASVKEKYKLPEKFILFVGSLEPRKNIKTLINAYSRLSEKLQKEYSLVIAGASGWLNSDIYKTVKDLSIKERVHFTGYIDKEDISALYSMSTVFVYPSLYEGFGLPILEAMACGTPVITSNTSSMPEVAGEAAVLITPTDVDAMVVSLQKILKDEALRVKMSLAGIEQAKSFTWERCARDTLDVYKKVAGFAARR